MLYSAELAQVRKISAELGCFSWTSDQYQQDIFNFLLEGQTIGRGVVEVGTYKGGLTAQLALICQKLGWPLWTLDVNPDFLNIAADLLGRVGLAKHVIFHLGPLDHFVSAVSLPERPVLVILDGDHHYDAVIKDIQSLYQLQALPVAAAFHDYSLRHPTSGERVSDAIKDSFGHWPIRYIGARMDGTGPYWTKDHPSEDGHWWEVPGSEGALVLLPERLL